MPQNRATDMITGPTLVLAVLRHGRAKPAEVLILTGGSSRGLARIVKLAESSGVPVRWVGRREMDDLTDDTSTEVAARLKMSVATSIAEAIPTGEAPALVLVLEGVEDPYNVGMILRTAWAAGADAVILEEHARQFPRNVLARSSAGASECMPVVFVDNLADALLELSSADVTTVAADSEGAESIHDTMLPDRIAIVVGGERRGLSRAVKSACEHSVVIPMTGPVQSLSAVSSAAVFLFEVNRRRNGG